MATTANLAKGWLHTTVGRKVVMALTGLFLIAFLVVHLAGNLLLLRGDGGEAFNAYAEFMSTNPFIRILEVLLFLSFVIHIYQGLYLFYHARKTRPIGYAVHKPQENSSFFSRTMPITGIFILIFLLVHLRSFFVESRILGSPYTLYDLCKNAFENPWYSGFYVVSMVLLAFHLAHGFYSGFQTLGLIINRRIRSVIQWAGALFAFLVPLGFAIIPVYFLVLKYF
jgi:succinate dehydrogenase / fumarate reductase cytochrome b subunit